MGPQYVENQPLPPVPKAWTARVHHNLYSSGSFRLSRRLHCCGYCAGPEGCVRRLARRSDREPETSITLVESFGTPIGTVCQKQMLGAMQSSFRKI